MQVCGYSPVLLANSEMFRDCVYLYAGAFVILGTVIQHALTLEDAGVSVPARGHLRPSSRTFLSSHAGGLVIVEYIEQLRQIQVLVSDRVWATFYFPDYLPTR